MDWLVVDELGRDRMTDFAQESTAEIIDARYTSALKNEHYGIDQQLPTRTGISGLRS